MGTRDGLHQRAQGAGARPGSLRKLLLFPSFSFVFLIAGRLAPRAGRCARRSSGAGDAGSFQALGRGRTWQGTGRANLMRVCLG